MLRAAALLVFGVIAALVVQGTVLLRDRVDRIREARRMGREAAEWDIANGTPRIRMPVDGLGDLPEDGVGIDRDTGLPIEDCSYWCGTCAAQHEDAEDDAYNERIRETLEAGSLERFRLGHKLRTRTQLASLFAAGGAVRLATDGATLGVGTAVIAVTYRHRVWDDGSDSHWIQVTTSAGESKRLRLFYPSAGALGFRPPRGPFEALVADGETTLILRDVNGYGWVVDLPSSVVVQVAGPVP
jgi:hypothetical protein